MNKISLLLLALILTASVSAVSVNAKTTNPVANLNGQLPEISGDYAVEGKPNMRLRVFVHGHKDAKAGRPTPPPIPASCDDPGSPAVIGSTGWKLPVGNFPYRVSTSSAPLNIGGTNFIDISIKGFSAWNDTISTLSGKPNPVYAGTTTKTRSALDGENIIAWGRTPKSALGITYTWYYPDSGLAVENDTILNNSYNWILNSCSENYYDAANILTHELGHWYGLVDHYDSPYTNNTMFGYGDTAETKKTTPAQGDITGLENIYK